MISVYGSLLQETTASALEDTLDSLKTFFATYQSFILIGVGLVILYFVVTRVLLRGTVYKTAQREPVCVLTMAGRERSLEYMEKFGEVKGIEAQIIRYLRKHGSIRKKYIEKTFGSKPLQALLEEGLVKIV